MTANYYTPVPKTFPSSALMYNRPLHEIDAVLTGMMTGGAGYAFQRSLTATTGAKTIAAGVMDVANLSFVTITSESGVTDDLVTLSNPVNGAKYILQAAAGHTITVKHNTGNIYLNGGIDVVLSGNEILELIYSPLGKATDIDVAITAPPASAIDVIVPRTVLGSAAASISITSIPNTYSHLLLITELQTVAGTGTQVYRMNGDTTAANYYDQCVIASGATPSPTENLGAVAGWQVHNAFVSAASLADSKGRCVMWILNYASTTMRKLALYRTFTQLSTASGNTRVMAGGGVWTNTANAISTIDILTIAGSNVAAGSAYELYGID